MLNTHGLDRLVLEAVRAHGRVDPDDLPGIGDDELGRVVRLLVEARMLTDEGDEATVTEFGREFLAQFE